MSGAGGRRQPWAVRAACAVGIAACWHGPAAAHNPDTSYARIVIAADAVAAGGALWAASCAVCHGDEGKGGIGPSVVDGKFLGQPGYGTDGEYYAIIASGSESKKEIGRPGLADGGMEAYGAQLKPEAVWQLVTWIRAQQQKSPPAGKP